MKVKLLEPSLEFEHSYKEYIVELEEEERYPFPLDFDHSDFPAMLQKLENLKLGIDLPDGYVPSSTYWLVSEGQILGVSNLRHYLNENIKHAGGHIGIGIRPKYRGRGLGNLLLGLTIEKAKAIGISEVHIHCYQSNPISANMILSCGGVLIGEVQVGAEVVQRYLLS